MLASTRAHEKIQTDFLPHQESPMRWESRASITIVRCFCFRFERPEQMSKTMHGNLNGFRENEQIMNKFSLSFDTRSILPWYRKRLLWRFGKFYTCTRAARNIVVASRTIFHSMNNTCLRFSFLTRNIADPGFALKIPQLMVQHLLFLFWARESRDPI